MKKILQWFDNHDQFLYRSAIFVITVGIILLLFPREGRFPYEYQKSKPWMHQDLYAPFDFPVLKTAEELRLEKDSLMKQFRPFFNYTEGVDSVQIALFEQSFLKQWDAFMNDSIDLKDKEKKLVIEQYFSKASESDKQHFLNLGKVLLSEVYKRGVVELNDQIEEKLSLGKYIVVITNNVGEERDYSQVFTLKSAYEWMMRELERLSNTVTTDRPFILSGFFKDLNLNNFIQPNLIYNQEASNNTRDELISQISLTKGMVSVNQRIIGNGEMVNDEKFNLLFSLETEYEHRIGNSGNFKTVLVGQLIIIICCVILLFLYLGSFRKIIYRNSMKTVFIVLLVLMIFTFTSMTISRDIVNIYVIPVVLVPIIIKTFYDSRVALFIHSITILLIGFLVPNGFEFIFLTFTAGVVGILSLSNVFRRSRLMMTALYVVLTYSVVYLGLYLMQGNKLTQIPYRQFLFFLANGALLLFAYPLIYVFEKIFGFLSDITLMELSDTNQPLLRELSEKAPGTFQHSLQVANLAEEAAFKIGANSLLVRTGSLYHDIGKIFNPRFFIENLNTEKNPHNDLPYEESAGIIIDHVINGAEYARKHRIPAPIIDFIRTHHGTSTVHFFYRSYMNKYPEREEERKKFVYPGPIPFTKEQVLVMMADSVEAASRSLKEITQKSISDLVDNIFYYQMVEEQYNDAPITYKDISVIKDAFKKKLMNIYHVRVEYPELLKP
ncbi:MAG TPA: HDIG domain-containing protein [Bacteroidales bacterium]|nr:HDIG domain-containing protein [Bacteroidales bacterium]